MITFVYGSDVGDACTSLGERLLEEVRHARTIQAAEVGFQLRINLPRVDYIDMRETELKSADESTPIL